VLPVQRRPDGQEPPDAVERWAREARRAAEKLLRELPGWGHQVGGRRWPPRRVEWARLLVGAPPAV
jgi:hypothetical protein